MATVFEVMAKLSGNSSGMVSAFKQAAAAAESYKDRVQQATREAIDKSEAAAKAKLAGTSAGSGFAGGFKGAIAGLGAVAATVGLGAFIAEAGRASDATDKFKATMSFAGLNTSKIDAATKAAQGYADQTVYDLPTIQNTIAQLASNGIKDYTGLTKAAGNLNAVAGGNAETFKSVAMTMTQTAGAGKLTTENWNQLANAIPGAAGPLMKALEQAGAYTGNFRKAMEEGEISSDEFNAALMKLGTKPVAVEAAKSTKTFEGAFGSLNATIVGGLTGALNFMKPAITGFTNLVTTGIGGAFKWIGNAVTGLTALLVKGDFTGALAAAFKVEEDSPVVNALFKARDALVPVIGGFRAMGAAWRDNNGDVTSDGFAGVMERIANGAREVTGGISAMFKAFVDGDGQVTSTGFAGVLENLGVKARAMADQLGPIFATTFAALGPAVMGVLPALLTLFTAISPVGMAIGALTPVIPILAAAAGQLAAVLAGALAATLQVVAPLIAGIVTGVANAVTWFMSMDGAAEALAAGIATFVVGLGIYKTVIFAITTATKAWAAIEAVKNAIMAVNPVTLIILGIAALVAAIVLLIMNWDNVVKFITNIWGGFIGWFTGVMDGFVGWLGGIWDSIVQGIMAFAVTLFAPLVGAFIALQPMLSAAWNAIVAWIVGAVSNVVTPIVDGFTAMWDFLTGIFNGIRDFIIGVWTGVFTLLTDIGAAFWAEHGAQLTAAWNFIVAIFTGILNFYISIWTSIVNTVVGAVTAAWNFIVTIWNAVAAFLGTVLAAIGAGIAAAWAWITGIISGALAAVWGVISSVFNNVWAFISGIFNRVSAFLGAVWGVITGVIRGAVAGVSAVISGWVNTAWSVISSTFQRVVGFLGGIWGNITAGVSGMVGKVGGFFSGMWSTITGALAGAGTWLLSAGRNIVQGLIDGIGQLAGTIGNAFLSMVPGWIVEPFKKALGIASPSKLFTQFGRWIVEGLINGVTAKGAAAVKAVRGVADKLTKGAEAHLKRYDALMRKAKTMDPGRDRNAVLSDARAERGMAAQLSRAAAMVQGQVRRVGQLAAQKTALAGRLKAAQKALTDATTVRTKKAADVSKNLSGEFDLGALVGYSAKDMVVQTKLIGDRIRNFGVKIAALKKAGLSAAMVDQVSALGSTDGAIMADQLLKGGSGVIAQMNSAYKGIGTASNSAGAMVADAMYKSGVDAARGLVNGISSQIKRVDGAATAIAKALVRRFRTELGIKSPSKVMEGEAGWVMAGVDNGLRKGTTAVVARMAAAAKSVAGVTFNAPKVPDIAAQLALPELVQNIRLNFIGPTPAEAMSALNIGGALPVQDRREPVINVHVMARVVNPFTGEEVAALVEDVAIDVTDRALTGTARAAKSKRGSAVGGW